MSLIAPDQHTLVFAGVAVLAWIGFAAEQTRWGRMLTGVVWTGGLAILLSNLNVIPKDAAAYDFVKRYLVPLAIPLFLMRVNLGRIFQETGKTLVAFVVGAVTTVIGVVLAGRLLELGILESELSGIFAATYIGGTLNFAASSEALAFPDSVLLSASLAADSLVGKSYLLILAALPAIPFIARFFGDDADAQGQGETQAEDIVPERPSLFSLATALTVSAVIVAVGYWLADILNMPSYGILFISALALAPGLLAPGIARRADGAHALGMVCAYLFFAAVGAGANVSTLFDVAASVMIFAILIVVVHAALLFPIARMMGLSLAETITASNACILGPTTAAALAAARGWNDLVTPGLLAGLFGYAIGTFVGVTLAGLV